MEKKKQQCQRNLWRRRRDRYKCMHTEVFFSMESMTWVKEKRIFFLYRELIRIASHHQKEKPQADPLLSFSFSKFFNQRLVDLSQFVSLFFFLAVGCSSLCLSLLFVVNSHFCRNGQSSFTGGLQTQKRIKTSIPFNRTKERRDP